MAENLKLKLDWLRCPRCGGKTRIQIRPHTVLEDAEQELTDTLPQKAVTENGVDTWHSLNAWTNGRLQTKKWRINGICVIHGL